jgi:tetratricopeptide (TPR) repeat protein
MADRRMPVILFMLVFAYFLYCAAPTLYWGDSAEMASVSCSLGVAHSPGYPLYTQIAGLFSNLPLDPLPFRTNVLSALLGALAAVLIFGAIKEALGSRFAGIIAVAGLIGCRAFMFYSMMAEVYMLHVILFSGAFYLIVKYEKSGSEETLFAALLLIFIGAANHLLMVFVLAAAIIYLALLPGHKWRIVAGPLLFMLGYAMINLFRSFDALPALTTYGFWSLIGIGVIYLGYVGFLIWMKRGPMRMLAVAAAVVFAFAAAVVVFCYLPLASAREPLANWWNPKNVVNFLNLIMLRGYESTLPANKLEWLSRVDLPSLLSQVPIPMAALSILGIVLLIRKRWRLAVFMLLVALGTFAGTLFIQHGKPEALRLPVYIVIYMFAGAGAAALPGWLLLRGPKWRQAIGYLAAAGAIAAALFNMNDSDWRFMNRSSAAYELGSSIINDTRTHSLLFLGTQTPSIIGYFNACEPGELRRKEIAVIPVSFLPFEWELEQLKREYRDEVIFPDPPADEDSQRPIFRADDPARARYALQLAAANRDRALYSDFLFIPADMNKITVPHGAVYQIIPEDTLPSRLEEMLKSDKSPDWRGLPMRDGTNALNIASVYNERGKIYLQFGYEKGNPEYMKKAMSEFDRALKLAPEYAAALSNKGQCLFYYRQEKKGMQMMERAIKLAPTEPGLYETLATVEFRRQTPSSVQKAVALWSVAAMLDQHNARAHNNIGSALVALEQKEAAVAEYRKAIAIDPDYISSYVNLARVYNKLKSCAAAADTLERAKDRKPDSLEIRSELAQQYYDCRLQHLYAQVMDGILNDFPQTLETYYTLAVIFRNVGQYDNLVAAMKELRKMEPDFPIQKIFGAMESCDRAIIVLEQVHKRMPDDPQIYLTLGVRYGICGRPKDAQKTLKEAERRFPNEEMFTTILKQVNMNMEVPQPGASPYDMAAPQNQ